MFWGFIDIFGGLTSKAPLFASMYTYMQLIYIIIYVLGNKYSNNIELLVVTVRFFFLVI